MLDDDDLPYLGTRVSAGRTVPLISSEVAGPLGLMHLPRLWLKALLLATGTLAEDWGCGPGGLDKRIMDCVGLDPETFVPWIMRTFPSYDACEAYVRAHARSLDAASIASSNHVLSTNGLPRGLVPKFRAYLGITDETVDVGIRLNNFDDWSAVHEQVLRHGAAAGPIVPAISPRTTGLLGVAQLPRRWLIALLDAEGLLPNGYRTADANADAALAALDVDPAAARAFIAREHPGYLAYEAWLRERGHTDADALARANAALDTDAATEIERGDWALLHARLSERRAALAGVPAAGIRAFSSRSQ